MADKYVMPLFYPDSSIMATSPGTSLNFCATCESKRIREVKEQLQELVDRKERQEDACAICCEKLSLLNKTSEMMAVKSEFGNEVDCVTIEPKVEYAQQSQQSHDDSDDFCDSLSDTNIDEEATHETRVIKQEPSTSGRIRLMTRLQTGAIAAREFKNFPHQEESTDDDYEEEEDDISDSSIEAEDSAWEPSDEETVSVSQRKRSLKTKSKRGAKGKCDDKDQADAVTADLPIDSVEAISVSISGDGGTELIESSSQEGEDDHHTNEDSEWKPTKGNHITRACIEIKALAPEVTVIMGPITDEERPYSCKFCDYKPMASARFFIRHVSTKHSTEITNPIKDPFQCNTCCDMKFGAIRHWLVHTKHKPYKCVYPDCKSAFSMKINLIEHELIHIGVKPYSCEKCAASFFHKHIMRKHTSLVHDKVKRFICQTCGVRFGALSTLQLHTRTHTKEKPFQCEICPSAFISKVRLKEHMYDHKGSYPFVCEVCGHGTKVKADLKKHMITHDDRTPWLCQQCGQSFKVEKSLIGHQRTVHNKEKKFQCRFCPKQFSYWATYRQHEKTHPQWKGVRKHVCETCGFDCQARNKLEAHRRIHTGEKPFHCQVCDFSCNRETNLETHMRRHTGEKPYQCKGCHMRFMYSEPYKNHRQICNVDVD